MNDKEPLFILLSVAGTVLCGVNIVLTFMGMKVWQLMVIAALATLSEGILIYWIEPTLSIIVIAALCLYYIVLSWCADRQ